ncbi:MAG: hypothetical protein A2015_08360 [Spirochaetes bacterium GWF1_31_7]|nr:MAG: hypothetical protein A2Y30_08555 [Spirochaetes bacterium GWE1_32_154]OHD47160.1 MAG: hypothetical protein A2015_08360 [Spirochaetes bacterium GWF1_31_7]OHD47469.1 MAG: hypothetical protein A2Y29_08780 [Spirochaetes bacterium GWE2_31_10]OHD83325.1 MAG: hypothetical protein A2355_17200 [Spirochaetes bacterium RIFOXYB1_FULL_32_8]HBD94955.1 hypothetical protein [Spirochaetia bacterium]
MGYVAVVEDEDTIRENIIEILHIENYQVKGFSRPIEFINYLKNVCSDDIDLIITDIMMPLLSGIEMIQKVSDFCPLHQIPVLYLTALGDENTITNAYNTVESTLTVDYVVKPFQLTWLLAKVKTMISLKTKNDNLRHANEDIVKMNLEITSILDTIDSENSYLIGRLKSVITKKNLEVDKMLEVVRDLIPKIAVNDLASLKFVANIIEKNNDIIERIVREPTEDDEFFKILPKTAEPLRTAIWDIEQTIKLFISLGIISQSSIDKISFEETSFYEILLKNYENGRFSTEQFKAFMNDTKFKKSTDDDVIIF